MWRNVGFDSYVKEYGIAKMVSRQTAIPARVMHLRHTMTQARLTHVSVMNPKAIYLDRIHLPKKC